MLLRKAGIAAGLYFLSTNAQTGKQPWDEFPLPVLLQVQSQASADDFPLLVLQQTLSGLVTRATRTRNDVPSLWIRTGEPDDIWRTRFVNRTGVPTRTVTSDVVALVKTYADLGVVKGFVAFAPESNGVFRDFSVNIATSLCAPLGAVAAGGRIIGELEALGLKSLANASQSSYPDLMNGTYDYNKNLLAILQTDQAHVRDLAVASGTLVALDVFNGGYSASLKTLNAGAAVFGWGAEEHSTTYGASTVGAGVVASDWSTNLATLSSGPEPHLGIFPQRSPVVDDGKSFYVAFVLSDGDNMQWLLNDFTTHPFWFGSPRRGSMPFTWGIHTSVMYKLAPDALSWFQNSITANDSFITFGDSYAYLDIIDSEDPSRFSTFVTERQPLSHALGLHSAVVFMEDWTVTTAYERFVSADPDVKALFPMQYNLYSTGQGKMWRTKKGVPVLSSKVEIHNRGQNDNRMGDPAHVADVLNSWAVNSTGLGIESRVAWVPVVAWSSWAAPADAADLAYNGQLGGYAAAMYAARRLQGNLKLVTLDDLASLLTVKS